MRYADICGLICYLFVLKANKTYFPPHIIYNTVLFKWEFHVKGDRALATSHPHLGFLTLENK